MTSRPSVTDRTVAFQRSISSYSSAAHRLLHSIPTRFSSDLPRYARSACRSRSMPSCTGWHRAGRSEEHTSELQSRENLVCRLLLEKKKSRYRPCSGRDFVPESANLRPLLSPWLLLNAKSFG